MNTPVRKTEKRMPGERFKDVVAFLETGEVSLFKNKDYQFSVFSRINFTQMRLIVCVFDTEACSNFVLVDVLQCDWLATVR